jgi:hypothetical protein
MKIIALVLSVVLFSAPRLSAVEKEPAYMAQPEIERAIEVLSELTYPMSQGDVMTKLGVAGRTLPFIGISSAKMKNPGPSRFLIHLTDPERTARSYELWLWFNGTVNNIEYAEIILREGDVVYVAQSSSYPSVRLGYRELSGAPKGPQVPAVRFEPVSFAERFNAAADRDPILGPHYRNFMRRETLATYEMLLPQLGIPAEKIPALKDLLVERAICGRLTANILREEGHKFNSPEVVAAISRAETDAEAKIKNLVGATAAQKLKEWNLAEYSLGQVRQDAVTLSDAGFQLNTGQQVKLAFMQSEIYSRELNPLARSGDAGTKVDPKSGLTQLEEQLFAREAEVLSPPEVAILRDWAIEVHRADAARANLGESLKKSK